MRIKNFIRKNYKIGIGVIIGLIISIVGVYASDTTSSLNVSYNNKTSKLTSTNMQGAIDELNEKATTKIAEAKNECPSGYSCTKYNTNIVKAYTYNQTSGASNYCIIGEEKTCKETKCYENISSGSCPAGTIIKYKVNNNDIKNFYVLHDDGKTMTLQQRENIVYNTHWNSSGENKYGPTSALEKIETATSSWTNVNNQTYQMGTTNFNGTNAYTGCDDNLNCTKNKYTLESRTARARMITLQEAKAVGCTTSKKSCPIWMYNYLGNSIGNGGTVNDGGTYESTDSNLMYHTMSSYSENDYYNFGISNVGSVYIPIATNVPSTVIGARAVVVVNK